MEMLFDIISFEGCPKSSKFHQKRGAIAEYFCRGNTLPVIMKLEKLFQISVLISL